MNTGGGVTAGEVEGGEDGEGRAEEGSSWLVWCPGPLSLSLSLSPLPAYIPAWLVAGPAGLYRSSLIGSHGPVVHRGDIPVHCTVRWREWRGGGRVCVYMFLAIVYKNDVYKKLFYVDTRSLLAIWTGKSGLSKTFGISKPTYQITEPRAPSNPDFIYQFCWELYTYIILLYRAYRLYATMSTWKCVWLCVCVYGHWPVCLQHPPFSPTTPPQAILFAYKRFPAAINNQTYPLPPVLFPLTLYPIRNEELYGGGGEDERGKRSQSGGHWGVTWWVCVCTPRSLARAPTRPPSRVWWRERALPDTSSQDPPAPPPILSGQRACVHRVSTRGRWCSHSWPPSVCSCQPVGLLNGCLYRAALAVHITWWLDSGQKLQRFSSKVWGYSQLVRRLWTCLKSW